MLLFLSTICAAGENIFHKSELNEVIIIDKIRHRKKEGECCWFSCPDLAIVNIGQDHRIIEYIGLGGTVKGHIVQLLYNEPGHLQLDQAACPA